MRATRAHAAARAKLHRARGKGRRGWRGEAQYKACTQANMHAHAVTGQHPERERRDVLVPRSAPQDQPHQRAAAPQRLRRRQPRRAAVLAGIVARCAVGAV